MAAFLNQICDISKQNNISHKTIKRALKREITVHPLKDAVEYNTSLIIDY